MERDGPRLAGARGPGRGFLELSADYLREYADKIRLGVSALSEEEVWRRDGEASNSPGNLILHLCGNLSLWVLKSVGREEYHRDRAAEFHAHRTHSREQLLERLDDVVNRCRGVLLALPEEALDRPLLIQNYATDVRGAVYHVVEHASYHTGQIVHMAKLRRESGALDFYPQHRDE